MIKVMFWNIQVYGKRKANLPANDLALANFIATVVDEYQVDVLAVCELMSSSKKQVQALIESALRTRTKQDWTGATTDARSKGNREAYGFFFRPTVSLLSQNPMSVDCAANEFPGNGELKKGRRAAYAGFQTQAGTPFVVVAYHAPTKRSQGAGIEAMAAMTEIRNCNGRQIDRRFLCGDFNLDYGDDYNPLLAKPVPDCTPTVGRTSISTVLRPFTDFHDDPRNWANVVDYLTANSRIDNILCCPIPAPAVSGALDLVRGIVDNLSISNAAAKFSLLATAIHGTFTGADRVRAAGGLKTSNGAFAFYRAAVSDHLPIVATIDFA